MSDAATGGSCTSEEVQALAALPLPALRRLWQERWREPPPSFRSRDLLSRAFAYRMQVEALGGLSLKTQRQICDYACRFVADRAFTPVAGPNLKPGSSLVREWRGVRHEVGVREDGFSYGGQTYSSLSKVAHAITGTKWNGHVFFGLKGRGERS